MKTAQPFPPFRQLMYSVGFARAYSDWQKHHRADEAVVVEAWPHNDFRRIHDEVELRKRAERDLGTDYDRPPNQSFRVTPTGGRLIICGWVDPVLGPPAPIDPPNDELLLLTWQYLHWNVRAEQAEQEFSDLKAHLRRAVKNGVRDHNALDELEELQLEAKELRATANEIDAKRQPLLPRALREPTPQEARAEQASAKWKQERESKFDKKLRALEL